MQIDANLTYAATTEHQYAAHAVRAVEPASALPAHNSLTRVLSLLGSANLRLSLFSFEALPGAMTVNDLFYAVENAVDDSGLAFILDNGCVGALVYGWRPPNADDSWVEDRTLSRLDWALGGPLASMDLVDVHAVHRSSSELSSSSDVAAMLSCSNRIHRVRHRAVA